MRTIIAFLALLAVALGQTKSADPKPNPAAFTVEERLRLEVAQLKLRLIQKEAAEAQAAGQAVFEGRCKAAGIQQEKCSMAPDGTGVVARAESPAKEKS